MFTKVRYVLDTDKRETVKNKIIRFTYNQRFIDRIDITGDEQI